MRPMTGIAADRISAPDLIERVVGFRKWRLQAGELQSPYVRIPWREPVAHADCHRSSLTGVLFEQHWLEEAHESPHPTCKCGIYAYHEPKSRPPMTYLRSVWGIVTLWGRLEVHRDGMRAQPARVEALALSSEWAPPQRNALRAVAEALGVDLVEHEDLRSAAGDYGKPVPEALRPEGVFPPRG